MTKTTLTLVILILLLILAKGIGKHTDKTGHNNYNQSKEEVLIRFSKETNKKLPVMVDKQTRLDSTLYKNKLVNYKYTLVNLTLNQLNVDKIVETIKPKLVKNYCTNKEIRFLLESNIEAAYIYNDKNGAFVTKISVNNKNCSIGS